MNDITEQLKTIFGDRLKEHEPLKKHTNFRVGGPARWLVTAKTEEEIVQGVKTARENDVPVFWLGGGSNVLVSDDGFDGLVMKMANRDISIDATTVVAEAGAMSAAVARQTVEAGLEGFAWAISLPGTIGGAVRGNAGCFGGEMKDVVASVRALCDGSVVDVPAKDLHFGYRESAIKHSNDTVLSVTLTLKKGDKDALVEEMASALAKRKDTQPLYAGSSGCMFKNYAFEEESALEKLKRDTDIPASMLEKKQISAGWLIDQMDLTGTQIGDAKISDEHGNFIINLGNATASDIVQLVSFVKMKARDRYGIQLEEEVHLVGF